MNARASTSRERPDASDRLPAPWRQVPVLPTASRGPVVGAPTSARRQLIAAVVAAAPPGAYMTTVLGAGRGLIVAVVVAVAAWLVGAVPVARWTLRAGALVASFLAADLAGLGEVYAAWAVAWIVVADWSVSGHPPLPGLPASRDGEAIAGVLVITALTCRQVHAAPHGVAHLVLTAAALAVTVVGAAWGPRMTSVARSVGSTAALVVSRVCFVLLGVLVVGLPWCIQRLLGLDPLRSRASISWNRRSPARVDPDRPWSVDSAELRVPWHERLRWAMVLPLVLLAGLLAWTTLDRPAVVQVFAQRPAALDGVDWWTGYLDELDWALDRPGGASNPQGYPPFLDVGGRFINIDDGHRVSWSPPPCGCRRLRVWIYGGSTAFGWGQRDGFTIPSQLARVAARHGISLDVSNRGIPGELNWRESQRFAWDVAAEDPPDLVVFYDGWNDLEAAAEANDRGELGYSPTRPTPWQPDSPTAAFDRNGLVRAIFGRPPDGAGRVPVARADVLAPDELGEAVALGYDRGRFAAVAAAESRAVPAVWFWHPDRYTRTPTAGEPRPDAEVEARSRRVRAAARDALPADVVDVADAFADTNEPLYIDDVHTNEAGARIVGERLYAELESTLRALATSP